MIAPVWRPKEGLPRDEDAVLTLGVHVVDPRSEQRERSWKAIIGPRRGQRRRAIFSPQAPRVGEMNRDFPDLDRLRDADFAAGRSLKRTERREGGMTPTSAAAFGPGVLDDRAAVGKVVPELVVVGDECGWREPEQLVVPGLVPPIAQVVAPPASPRVETGTSGSRRGSGGPRRSGPP